MKKRITASDILIYVIVSIFILFCILPFILVVSASLSDEEMIVKYGLKLWPQNLSFEAYRYAFKYPQDILNSYGVTIFVTAIGTILNLLFTILLAYPLSKASFRYRRPISVFLFFTMLFNGGLVPTYILLKNYLHLYDTIWVMIIPLLIVPGNVFLLRVFFQGVPSSLYESALMDGADEFSMLTHVALPLSKAGIATITFFIILLYWNDSFTGLMFVEDPKLTPLQLLLTRLVNYIQYVKTSEVASGGMISATKIPDNSLLFAMCVIATGPMIFVFSFFQKYFVRGLLSGAIKE